MNVQIFIIFIPLLGIDIEVFDPRDNHNYIVGSLMIMIDCIILIASCFRW